MTGFIAFATPTDVAVFATEDEGVEEEEEVPGTADDAVDG